MKSTLRSKAVGMYVKIQLNNLFVGPKEIKIDTALHKLNYAQVCDLDTLH